MSDVQALSYEAIAKGSKSFAAASKLLAPDVRDDVVRLYAWCRHCDDTVDGQTLGGELEALSQGEQRRRLAELEAQTSRALRTDEPVAEPYEALRAVARAHDFPEAWPLDHLKGFRMDVERHDYRTLDDVLLYSYHVAGVVGIMMARIMGVRDEAVLDRACDLGLAFQLTNIARDVIEDARGGRTYLPAEWLDAPVDPDDPAAVMELALRLVEAAEPYYASAAAGLPALPFRSAWAIASARRIYRQIGLKAQAATPEKWAARITTGKRTKARLVAKAWTDAVRSRGGWVEVSREGLWTRSKCCS